MQRRQLIKGLAAGAAPAVSAAPGAAGAPYYKQAL